VSRTKIAYHIIGIVSIALGTISFYCRYYIWYLENIPVDILKTQMCCGMTEGVLALLISVISSIGAILGSIALFKKAVLEGIFGLTMNLAFLVYAIHELFSG